MVLNVVSVFPFVIEHKPFTRDFVCYKFQYHHNPSFKCALKASQESIRCQIASWLILM